VKVGQKQGKKEKKKETQFLSMPLYIRASEENRQALGFP
jgi:hypothetical protein